MPRKFNRKFLENQNAMLHRIRENERRERTTVELRAGDERQGILRKDPMCTDMYVKVGEAKVYIDDFSARRLYPGNFVTYRVSSVHGKEAYATAQRA
jgi:hypothetical protein